LKRLSPNKQILGYIGILAIALAIAVISGRTSLATQIDDYAYDWMFRLDPPASRKPHCMILAIDDPTYSAMGGVAGYRPMLAKALPLLKTVEPKVVAVDMVLADKEDPAVDGRLTSAMQGARNLVLVAHLSNGHWEVPLPGFAASTAALGHDEADENSRDGVTRQIPLEERTASARYWSLALEAFRLARDQPIIESPEDLQIGNELIPAARTSEGNRPLRVLYTMEPIPQISLKDLVDKPQLADRFRGQVVFLGVTSISGS
jgi:adenylate cyclase